MTLLRWAILIDSILIAFTVGSYFTYTLLIGSQNLIDSSIFSAYLSAAGGLLGGLTGGIVAFVVAKSQINYEKKREKEKQNNIFLNILRALENELKHNKEVLEILNSSQEDKDKYIHSLESNVWEKVKFDVNNFLPAKIYSTLDDTNREFKDIKEGILPEYENKDDIDYQNRIKVISAIVGKVEEEQKKYNKTKGYQSVFND